MIVKCPKCPYEALPYSVRRHMRAIHKLSNEVIKDFNDGLKDGTSNLAVSVVCQLCSKTFKSKQEYTEHARTHSKKSKFVKCGFCPFSTADLNKMNSHAMDCIACPYTNCYIGSREERSAIFSCNVCSRKFENRKLISFHFENDHSDAENYLDKKFENMTTYKEWFYEINKSADECLSVRSSKHIEGFKRLYLRCQTDSRRPIPMQSSRLEEKPTYVYHYCPAYLVVTESRQYVRVQGIIDHIHKDSLDCVVMETVKEKNDKIHEKCLVELEGASLDELEEDQWRIGDEIINYNGSCQCQSKNTHCEICDCCSFNFSCSCSNMERVPCIHMHFLSMKIRQDKNKKQEESLLMVVRHKRIESSNEEKNKKSRTRTKRTRRKKLKPQTANSDDVVAKDVEPVKSVKKAYKSFRFRTAKKPPSTLKLKKLGETTQIVQQTCEPQTPSVDVSTVANIAEKSVDSTITITIHKTATTEVEDVEALFADLIHEPTTDSMQLAFLDNEDIAILNPPSVCALTTFMMSEQEEQQSTDISTEVLSNFLTHTERPFPESILEDSFNRF